MIESPVLQALLAERTHRLILLVLEDRCGPVPAEVVTALGTIQDEDRLMELVKVAARCPHLEAFRQALATQ
jgi:hypothetical protein